MSGLDAPAAESSADEWSRARASGLGLRPMTEADLPFLLRVYASTRVDELAPVPWSEAEKAKFLASQFDAQHAHYMQNYAGAAWRVVERAGTPIGRLYTVRWPREHRVIDIAFVAEHRGHGYGTALLGDLLDAAARAAKPLTIHVEKFNPARRLYDRLGFRPIGEHGVYDLLERRPGQC